MNKYNNLINELKKNSDQIFQKFTTKITNPQKEMLGVKIPVLKNYAKEVAQDLDSFLLVYQGKYFEETMIYGLALGYLPIKELLEKHLINYSLEIGDWSLCDSPSLNMKIIKKNRSYFLPIIETLLASNQEFQVRFGLVLLLSQYLSDDYLDYILNKCITIKSDKYYINMALAWLVCECYIKYPLKTERYLSEKYLSKFVLNKSISKICDSFRVDINKKLELKTRRV